MFQDFRYSDTARLSRSVEVLKLKNFKKDATLKLSKSSNQEWYEHVGPEVASSQDGKVSRWQRDYAWLMISRCSRSQCQIQVQGTSSIQKSMITTTYSPEKVKKVVQRAATIAEAESGSKIKVTPLERVLAFPMSLEKDLCRHLCQHHVPSPATTVIVLVICQANDHGFVGLGGFSALGLYDHFKQLDLLLMVKHGYHV
ncbi:hypothetical protein Tco_0046977 [Tanacetum coccineum]